MEIFIDSLKPKEYILALLEKERRKIKSLVISSIVLPDKAFNKVERSLKNFISLIEEFIVIEIANKLKAKYEDAIVVNTILIPFYIEVFKIKITDIDDRCLVALSKLYCPPCDHVPPSRYWKVDKFYTKFTMIRHY